MQRRKFIKNTLVGFPLIFSPALFALNSKEIKPNGKTVVVIGAGISGLAAAKKLKEKGFNVIVFEAQNKVGGRLRTNRTLGLPFDEGASWIHGTIANPITNLAQQAGMNTAFTDDESLVCYDINGVLRNDTAFSHAEAELKTILNTLKNSGSATQSFETVFNRVHPTKVNDRLWKFLLSAYVTFDLGDLDKVSSTLYDEGEELLGEERIATNGYDMIPNFLANDLTIQLNQRVSKIDYSGAKIKVTHNDHITEADYVVITVPLGVLKSGNLQFIPNLPTAKLNAIQKIGMNCVNKFLLTWDTGFWDNEQYICYTPEIKDKFNYFVNVKKFNPKINALMTFAYADYARQTETMSDTQIIDEIMLHLRDIYGNHIPNPTHFLRTKWQTNENSFGAYSFIQVGTEMQHFADLAQDINDKLFFAGEHTHIDYFSKAHGAYLSGIREANKIMVAFYLGR
ncbi:flavin monoamine oxidase family protein [Thioflexithrix psekupsensis]|uniref:Tryptophan 2-monooxygenase n=1 Tax=Thioflexithrix psekupsensis TaxID=1570016 RepID=A0A251X3L0_9GAMM|nr:NAD(P)/FAD-dependent oxidoreductase [Thioflexithrix psekupsensis]OUD11758.1 amine oxidase [Thioflexithrix psekupsensis]